MAIEGAQVDVAADPAARTKLEPRNSVEQCRSHYQRLQRVSAAAELFVQAFDRALRFGPRAGIGSLPLALLPFVLGANVLIATLTWITVWLFTR
jgi:hypothetical protein